MHGADETECSRREAGRELDGSWTGWTADFAWTGEPSLASTPRSASVALSDARSGAWLSRWQCGRVLHRDGARGREQQTRLCRSLGSSPSFGFEALLADVTHEQLAASAYAPRLPCLSATRKASLQRR